jgi:hypothetical protein
LTCSRTFKAVPPSRSSARATLPSLAIAAAFISGSSASRPSASAAARATSSAPSGRSASRRQRERMVGSSRPGEWLTTSSRDFAGGSSRIFSSAFAPAAFSSSAASTIQMRQPPSPAVEPKKPIVRRTSSTWITVRSLPLSPSVRSSASRSLWPCAATRRTAGLSGGSVSDVAWRTAALV